jgi:uncharacterized protein
MSPLEVLAILGAGMAAGTMNVIVGAGSLISFPTLLLFGYPPLIANVSNTVGLVPGVISGSVGYRRELVGQRSRAAPLVIAAMLGGLTGGLVLLVMPASAFERIVPILILVGCVLVAIQPRLSRALEARRAAAAGGSREVGPALFVGVYLTGVYGGYFGAAMGVIIIALLAIFVADDIQRLNGLKIVLATAINGVAAILFILLTPIAWPVAILIAIGAILGGQIGAHVGRRLSPFALRAVIIIVGAGVAMKLLIG